MLGRFNPPFSSRNGVAQTASYMQQGTTVQKVINVPKYSQHILRPKATEMSKLVSRQPYVSRINAIPRKQLLQ
eukprot:1130119-Pleurochrysis_carterae.AAC.6